MTGTPKVLFANANEQGALRMIELGLAVWVERGDVGVATHLSEGYDNPTVREDLHTFIAGLWDKPGMTETANGRAQVIATMLARRAEILGNSNESDLYRSLIARFGQSSGTTDLDNQDPDHVDERDFGLGIYG
jgi:hypothetical protein